MEGRETRWDLRSFQIIPQLCDLHCIGRNGRAVAGTCLYRPGRYKALELACLFLKALPVKARSQHKVFQQRWEAGGWQQHFSSSSLVVRPKCLLVTPHQSPLLHVTLKHAYICSTEELNWSSQITFLHGFTKFCRAPSNSSEEHVEVQSYQLWEAALSFLLSIRCSRPGLWQTISQVQHFSFCSHLLL